MSRIKVYGHSDDCIEIEDDDGKLREEFEAYDEDDGNYLAFADGTVLHIVYNKDNDIVNNCHNITEART